MPNGTSNQDIAELRRLAGEGVTRSEADRWMGRSTGWARYWAKRENIAFRSDVTPASANAARDRLAATLKPLWQAGADASSKGI